MAEPQRGVAGDRTLALDDLRDAVGRHAQLTCKFGWRYRDLAEFFGQDFAGMNGEPPGDLPRELPGPHVAFFDPQIQEVAAAGGGIHRDFLDLEVFGLDFDLAADAG